MNVSWYEVLLHFHVIPHHGTVPELGVTQAGIRVCGMQWGVDTLVGRLRSDDAGVLVEEVMAIPGTAIVHWLAGFDFFHCKVAVSIVGVASGCAVRRHRKQTAFRLDWKKRTRINEPDIYSKINSFSSINQAIDQSIKRSNG